MWSKHVLHSTKLGQLPQDQFFSGKIEFSNEGRVHRILKQLEELRSRSVVFFGDFASSEIGQLGEKAGGGQMLQKWLLGSIWCVFICSPLKICKKVAQTSPQQISGLFSHWPCEQSILRKPCPNEKSKLVPSGCYIMSSDQSKIQSGVFCFAEKNYFLPVKFQYFQSTGRKITSPYIWTIG